MVFNGEVYNYAEIRAELEPLGHRFGGTGDSEVILAAFVQWGPEAVRRFIGMFAIAVWHQATHRLYLLRDRLGVKPLYYGQHNGVTFFGSELKALRAFGCWPVKIDRDALTDYFRYGYIGDPRAIYAGVHKLMPGHFLMLDGEGNAELSCYWNIVDQSRQKLQGNEDDLADELEALMTSAFRYRMIADVPVGVFLSGGLDSSILTALIQKHSGQQVKTFTIGFNDVERNEAPYAEAVAHHLGTEHRTRILEVREAEAVLPQWGSLYDEPFGDSSGIPTLLVSKMAAEHVKVVLSADGGDELFSGYFKYTNLPAQHQRLKQFSAWQQRTMRGILGVVPWQRLDDILAEQRWPGQRNQELRYGVTVRFSKIRDRLGVSGVGAIADQALSQAFWPDSELSRLLGTSPPTRINADQYDGLDGERLCLWDLHNYLPGDVLTKVDRATMRASIEGREPMIDHRLVEFAFSLPYELRQGALGSKHLLRKVLYRHVPRHLIDRPKQGFAIPLGKWLTTGLRHLLDKYLDDNRIREQGLLNPDTVRTMVRRLDAGDKLSINRVWLLLAFQMWHEQWMEGDARPVGAAAEQT